MTNGSKKPIIELLSASSIDNQIIWVDAYIKQLQKEKDAVGHDWMEKDLVFSAAILDTLVMARQMVKSITNVLMEVPSNQPTDINEEITEFVELLKQAKALLKKDEPLIGDIDRVLKEYIEIDEEIKEVMHTINEAENCTCGVPADIHGTCCGWFNAKALCDDQGKIIDKRHPGYGEVFTQWQFNKNEPFPVSHTISQAPTHIQGKEASNG